MRISFDPSRTDWGFDFFRVVKRKDENIRWSLMPAGTGENDITYSGTVSAAMEGTLLGVPSIAMSLAPRDPSNREAPPDFAAAALFAARLAGLFSERGMPRDTLLNVNVPGLPAEELRGYVITRQGKRRYGDAIVEHVDPRGRKYYWIGGEDLGFVPGEGTDCPAVAGGYISVTLCISTDEPRRSRLVSELKIDWP
jgi:5'/3'-nucleotidase SurE